MELAHNINRKSLEDAVREARRLQTANPQLITEYRTARRGAEMCARAVALARQREPRLLLALDKAATILRDMSEEQAGPHGIDMGGFRVPHTEFQVFRNALVVADGGKATEIDPTEIEVYQWTYVAAGILAGVLE